MDGLFRCAAPAVLFTAGGRLVPLKPMTVGVLAACESYIVLARGNVADEVEDTADRLGLSNEQRDQMRWKAYEELKADRTLRFVKVRDLADWMYTADGVIHTAYWCLKDSGLKAFTTPEGAEKQIVKEGPEWIKSFLRARDHASGIDLLSSMDWPDVEEKGRPDGKYRPISWRLIYRKFADAYGWPPSVVDSLTLYDVKIYSCEEKELGGTMKVSHADLMTMKGKRGG